MEERLAAFCQGFLISLLVSAALAYPIYRMLLSIKARQNVSAYLPVHQGKQGTPTMGGLIVLAGVLAALAATESYARLPILALILGFGLIGFIDDFVIPRRGVGARGLAWAPKLVLQVLVALSVMWLQYEALYKLGEPPANYKIAFIVTSILVMLFFSNAYNFVDGLDGMAGFVGIALAIGIAACGLVSSKDIHNQLLCGAIVGGLISFLALNAHPAKVFMGDVGALPIGALLGVVTLGCFPLIMRPDNADSGPKLLESVALGNPLIWAAFLALSLVLLIEIVPVPLQILSVKLRKKRLFPKTPLHHALEDMGIPETKIVAWMALAQILCSVLALGLMLVYTSRGIP